MEKSDVRKSDEKGFYGCAPGKIVRLRFGPFVKITEVNDHSLKGEIVPETEIKNFKKIKGILHWVGEKDSIECEIRVYNRLLTVPISEKNSKTILNEINPLSRIVYKNARVPKGLLNLIETHPRWQFERKGYYFVDKDTDAKKGKYVWN